MEIHWVNGHHPEDKRIFDSEMEVYEWTHSLYPDISIYLTIEPSVGYATPDKKVLDLLTKLIPQWAEYLKVKVVIHRDEILEDEKYIYRI